MTNYSKKEIKEILNQRQLQLKKSLIDLNNDMKNVPVRRREISRTKLLAKIKEVIKLKTIIDRHRKVIK